MCGISFKYYLCFFNKEVCLIVCYNNEEYSVEYSTDTDTPFSLMALHVCREQLRNRLFKRLEFLTSEIKNENAACKLIFFILYGE